MLQNVRKYTSGLQNQICQPSGATPALAAQFFRQSSCWGNCVDAWRYLNMGEIVTSMRQIYANNKIFNSNIFQHVLWTQCETWNLLNRLNRSCTCSTPYYSFSCSGLKPSEAACCTICGVHVRSIELQDVLAKGCQGDDHKAKESHVRCQFMGPWAIAIGGNRQHSPVGPHCSGSSVQPELRFPSLRV